MLDFIKKHGCHSQCADGVDQMPKAFSRRDILKGGAGAALLSAVPFIGMGDANAAFSSGKSRVSIHNAHTGDSFNGVYRVGDRYIPEAFDRLNYVLRDFRTGEVFPMDPHVIDILSALQLRSGSDKPFEILSGYRSPKTNSNLRKASTGVAKNSFHMYGQALDIRNADLSTRQLQKTALSLKAGGVGYYPKSGFVHIDTGNVRSW